jgi:hypothetical protein
MAAIGHFLTTTISKLDLLCNGKVLGSATGFFLKRGENWYVVTNWHVLSGRDPGNGQPRHSSGAVPDVCRFFTAKFQDDKLAWFPTEYFLGDALSGSANWRQHPAEGQKVDVGILPLGGFDVGLAKDILDPSGHDPDMFVDLGGELFIPGFPFGLSSAGLMPLWKRASLASSLEFGEGIKRFFYVDTATREGMSGAPCLAVSNWRHCRMDRKTSKMTVIEQPLSVRLLGVYSGRRNASDNFEAQIGVVWREGLIYEAIASGIAATVVL